MTESTYRPGDIAMVSDKPAVRVERQLRSGTVVAAWRYLDDEWMPPLPDGAVGPVLGNVADIAAGKPTDIDELSRLLADGDEDEAAYIVAYARGRNYRLEEIADLKAEVVQARLEGRREALAQASDRLTSKQGQVYGGAPSNGYLDGQYEAYEAAVDIVDALRAEHPQEAP